MEPIYIQSRITGGHWALQTDTSDKPFENPMDVYTKIKLLPTDTVADIGAYVGEYSLWAVRQNVKRILSYEPTPYTFNILKKNAKPPMELFNVAVVGDNSTTIPLYISKGIGVTNSIAKAQGKQRMMMVPTIQYETAVNDATVVKIDVEGAEYGYPIFQPHLRAIILEFHPISQKPWKQWAEMIMNKIEQHGYKRIVKPTFKSGWSLTGCWQL